MSDPHDPLDRLLTDARADFAFPPTPALRWTGATTTGRRSRVRLALIAAAIATLILAGAALGAAALGIGPLRILFVEALPSANVSDTPLAVRLALGSATTADDPSLRVPLLAPADLGPADEVYRSTDGRRVSQVWAARDALPATGESEIGLLVMALSGEIEPEMMEKLVTEFDVTVEPLTVRGHPGYWISGERHLLRYRVGAAGATERSRLVGDTLVWAEGGAVYRIESALGRDATLALAESMR